MMRSQHAHALIVPRRGGAVWTPATDVALYDGWWMDPDWAYAHGSMSLATQPAIADADMEAAGTGDWSALNATLSKESGSPGGSGSQVLRVVRDATSGTTYGYQSLFLIGNRYLITALARSDGTLAPSIILHKISLSWTGVASSAWQNGSLEETATGATLYLGCADSAATPTEWFEFDDVTTTNLSITSETPRAVGASFAGLTFEQATAADMPWVADGTNSKKVKRYDGVSDTDAASLAAASFNFMHSAAGFSAAGYLKADAAMAGQGFVWLTGHTTSVAGAKLVYDAGNERLLFSVYNASGVAYMDIATAVGSAPVDTDIVWELSYDEATGGRIRINGGAYDTSAVSGSASAADAASAFTVGDYSSYEFMGDIGQMVFLSGYHDMSAHASHLRTEYGL